MLQIVAGCVAIAHAVIRVSILVQGLAEHLTTQLHSTAYKNSANLAELDVIEAVAATGECAAVAHLNLKD